MTDRHTFRPALKVAAVGLATLLAAGIAFCAVCTPLGWAGFAIGGGLARGSPNPYSAGAIWAAVVGGGAGLVAAFFAGRFVFRYLRKRLLLHQ